MKTAARIRIVTWSIVLVLLVALLVSGLRGKWSGFSFGWTTYTYADADRYTPGNGSFKKDKVKNVDVNWVSGNITVEEHDSDEIVFSEENEEIDEKYKMHYYLQGDTLRIQFCQSTRWDFFRRTPAKRLTVKIPKGYVFNELKVDATSSKTDVSNVNAKKIDVETVSGQLDISDVKADTLELETVSGSLAVKNAKADKVKFNSVSGKVGVNGDFVEVDGESVSGGIQVQSKNRIAKAKLEAVSGSVTLKIPELKGFSAKHESVSGSFNCEFPTTNSKKRVEYKDGSAEFDFETVSGSINILKAS